MPARARKTTPHPTHACPEEHASDGEEGRTGWCLNLIPGQPGVNNQYRCFALKTTDVTSLITTP